MIESITKVVKPLTPKSVRRVIRRAGAFFAPRPYPFPSIESSLRCLHDWGFRPAAVIDVGAYHGEWTKLTRKIFPGSKVLMVEGQESKSEQLAAVCGSSNGEVRYEIALLGAVDGQEVKFVEMETGSSVYEESSPYNRRVVTKTLRSLDSLVARYPDFRRVDLLKLDVQGYELEVLKGAGGLLRETEVILLEASLIPINQGCPLIGDVIRFMDERSYRLLDFCSQIRRKDGALWQTDLLFIKTSSRFMPTPALTVKNW